MKAAGSDPLQFGGVGAASSSEEAKVELDHCNLEVLRAKTDLARAKVASCYGLVAEAQSDLATIKVKEARAAAELASAMAELAAEAG